MNRYPLSESNISSRANYISRTVVGLHMDKFSYINLIFIDLYETYILYKGKDIPITG